VNGPDGKGGADNSSQMMPCGGGSNGNRNGNGGRGTMAEQIRARRQSGGVRVPRRRCLVDGQWRLPKAAAEAEMAVAADILLFSSSVIIVGKVFA
jgi:hypothetical protein